MHWKKKGDLAFGCLGAALLWPMLGYALFDTSSQSRTLVLLLGPSLVLVAAAALLFISAARD